MKKDAFSLFEKEMEKIVRERFSEPTKIQEVVIPEILEGKDVLVIAETGSGKTESVMLPFFDMWKEEKPKPISILYITPLRSLNRDLLSRIEWWGKEVGFRVDVRHGDTTASQRSKQARKPSDMLISTPETLQAMLTGKLMRDHIKNVKWIVIDEVHELVDSKRGVQLSVGVERLKELIKEASGKYPQIVGISATIGSPEKVAAFLGGVDKDFKVLNTSKHKRISIKVELPRTTREDREVSGDIHVSPETVSRLRVINSTIKERNSVLVFTNTRESSEVLSSRLRMLNKKIPIETHHSSLSKEVRIKGEKDFKEQKVKALLCTSSLELGIDIGSVDFVLQYMSPRQAIKLLQRVGRSGHSLAKLSEGIVLSGNDDDLFESSVITRLAMERWVEPTKIYEKAWDVLGHQIVGMSLDEYNIPVSKAFRIVKRSYPYRKLTEEEFLDACRFMEKLGLIWLNDKFTEELVIRRRRNSFLYYYSNLSTIPDVKNYQIFDIVSNQPVGSLDAGFIALNGSPGTTFVVKGNSWRIIDVGEKRITVEPVNHIEAAIPAWEGELIPVRFEVAQMVGRLRDEIQKMIRKGERDIAGSLMKRYPVTRNAAASLIGQIQKQLKFGEAPTDRKVIIEHSDDRVVINSCFGSLVNDTIGRAISKILNDKMGSVGLNVDPYRIMLKLPGNYWKDVVDVLQGMDSKTLTEVLESELQDTELFRWRFLHVAKRLGIIRKNAEFGKGYLRKVIEVYQGTPAYKEALNEIFQDKLDVGKSLEVLGMMKRKEIKLSIREGLTPISEMGLTRKWEIVPPKRPEGEFLEIFMKRIDEKVFGLICMNCGEILKMGKVSELPEKPVCRKCEAKLLAPVPSRWVKDAQKLVKRNLQIKSMKKEDEKHMKWMEDSASLVISYGIDAARALSGRGVGPRTAARILQRREKGDQLYKNIFEAEKNYVKTRRFWKIRG